MRSLVVVIAVLPSFVCAQSEPTNANGDMIVVIGAGGSAEYEETFFGWADQWQGVAKSAKLRYQEIGRSDEKNDREKLQSLVAQLKVLPNDTNDTTGAETPLWIVMLGHGTSERNVSKFNLRGPDVASTDLRDWLADCERPLVFIHGFSCSGAFLKDLRGSGRVVITATKSGAELNYSRFGGFMAEAVNDLAADLDHDEQVSLLEAFLLASSKVARFYESESRLATEHSLLEDNDDGKGTSADFFVGIRSEGKAKDGSALDGRTAHRYILLPSKNAPQLTAEQLAERDRLEAEIEALRSRKATLSEDEYYSQLEELMVTMARLYQDT